MWSNWFPRIFLAALAWIAYYPVLDAGRVWDDHLLFAENPVLSGQVHWREAFQQPFFPFEIFYRPLTILTLKTVPDDRSLHFLSILLHMTVVLGVQRWARSLGAQRFAAFALAGLFAVHPALSEAVSWIAGMGDLWTATLGVWGLWCLANPGNPVRLGAGFVLLGLAPFCKETGILFLPVALLTSFTHSWEARRRVIFFVVLFIVVGGGWHALRNHALGVPLHEIAMSVSAGASDGSLAANTAPVEASQDTVAASGSVSGLERTSALFGIYVRLALSPWPLNLCHVIDRGAQLGWTLIGTITLGGLAFAAFAAGPKPSPPTKGRVSTEPFSTAETTGGRPGRKGSGRGRLPAAVIPVSWLLLLGVPAVLFLPPGTTLLAERYVYVPMIGVAVLVALAASRIRERFPTARGRGSRSVSMVGIAVLVLFLGLTQRRAAVWAYEDILYEETMRREPRAVPIAVNLGLSYRRMGRDAEARFLYAETIEAVEEGKPFFPYDLHDETYPRLLFEHGTLSAQQGAPKDAERSMRLLLELDPKNERGWISLTALLGSEGRYDEASELAREALTQFPRSVQLWLNLGLAQLRQGNLDEAKEAFSKVLRLDPDNQVAQQRLRALSAPE